MHVYACLLLCFMLMLTSLDALRGLDLVWLHSMPMRPCLDVTIWEASPDARLLRIYPSLSTLCDAMHTMFVHATHWLSMHLYMLAHMSIHESCLLVCCPCFNKMKLWTFNSNLHLSLVDTTFCLLSCLFAFLLICLCSCFSACHVYHAYLLYASFICSLYHFLPLLVCWFSCLCLCMYTHGVRTQGVRALFPMRKQKRHGCKHVDISRAAIASRFRSLAFSCWLCTLLNPFLPPPFLP